MRKLIAMAILSGTVSITACTSTGVWGGMPYSEIQAWSGIGIQGSESQVLRSNGFTPEDTRSWVQYGITSPQTIISWKRAGFTAEQTVKWLNKGITLNEAIDLTR